MAFGPQPTNEATATTPKNKPPIKQYRAGAIQLSVWENEAAEGQKFYTTTFKRSYVDKNKKWQDTQTLRIADIPKLCVLLNQCYAEAIVNEKHEEQ